MKGKDSTKPADHGPGLTFTPCDLLVAGAAEITVRGSVCFVVACRISDAENSMSRNILVSLKPFASVSLVSVNISSYK